MFIFFYMNISLFLRDIVSSLREIFKASRAKLIVFAAVFAAGMILGFVFFRRIEETEWLFLQTTDIVIIVVQSKNFFALWFQNFWKFAKIITLLFCLNLFSFGRHLHFVLIAVRGLVFGVGGVVLITEFGFMGVAYLMLVFLARSAFLAVCIFVGRAICISDGPCCNRNWWYTAKKYLFMLVAALLFCLLLTLMVFLFMRPLFAVG